MDNRSIALGIVLGVGGLLALKYLVIGLCAWDHVLHPGRIEPPSLRAFMKPFLAGVHDCPHCAKFWGVSYNG